MAELVLHTNSAQCLLWTQIKSKGVSKIRHSGTLTDELLLYVILFLFKIIGPMKAHWGGANFEC